MNGGLVVKNLQYKELLNNITFTLNEGTITALMGKNGSGKTLILKSIFGLINYCGEICSDGMIVNKKNITDVRKKIVDVLQKNHELVFLSWKLGGGSSSIGKQGRLSITLYNKNDNVFL